MNLTLPPLNIHTLSKKNGNENLFLFSKKIKHAKILTKNRNIIGKCK